MSSLTIGLCQDPELLGDARFQERLQSLNLLIFPELVDGGYAALSRGEGLHTLGDPFVGRFRRATARMPLCCVAGSMRLRSPRGGATNTCLVFQGGRLVHRYDKVHLFRPCLDHRYFRPGDAIGTFSLRGGRVAVRAGIAICYDLRFPELIRAMAWRGMELLLVPARWPAARDMAWQTLLKARAIENQIFVVGHNARGDEGGHSYVFDPFGDTLYASHQEPDQPLAVIRLDLARIAQAHLLHRNIREARVLRQASLPVLLRERRMGKRHSARSG